MGYRLGACGVHLPYPHVFPPFFPLTTTTHSPVRGITDRLCCLYKGWAWFNQWGVGCVVRFNLLRVGLRGLVVGFWDG
jgi:hypothetical protein